MNRQRFKRVTRLVHDLLARARGGWERIGDPLERRRLVRRLGRGELTHVPCLEPFRRLEFIDRGLVTACCPAYTRVHDVGSMKRGTIAGIWNGAALQRIRRRLMLGETAKVCRSFCPYLQKGPVAIEELPETNEAERRLKEDLRRGRSALTAPPVYFALSNWGNCNLRCVMCESWREESMPDYVRRTHEELLGSLGHPMTLMLSGAGDPLARADTRELLMRLSEQPNPNIKIEILTNGLLWTEAMWAKIRGCNFTMINVSIDAATAATYERIRKGGKWAALLRALEVIRRAKEAGAFPYVVINMTVMRSNYREIPAFVALAREHGFCASFAPVRGRFDDENIFDPGDRAALAELGAILDDAGLYGPEVNLAPLAGWRRK